MYILMVAPADVDVPHPDEKSIITYVSSVYDVMPRVPDVHDGIQANVRTLKSACITLYIFILYGLNMDAAIVVQNM